MIERIRSGRAPGRRGPPCAHFAEPPRRFRISGRSGSSVDSPRMSRYRDRPRRCSRSSTLPHAAAIVVNNREIAVGRILVEQHERLSAPLDAPVELGVGLGNAPGARNARPRSKCPSQVSSMVFASVRSLVAARASPCVERDAAFEDFSVGLRLGRHFRGEPRGQRSRLRGMAPASMSVRAARKRIGVTVLAGAPSPRRQRPGAYDRLPDARAPPQTASCARHLDSAPEVRGSALLEHPDRLREATLIHARSPSPAAANDAPHGPVALQLLGTWRRPPAACPCPSCASASPGRHSGFSSGSAGISRSAPAKSPE